MESVEIDENDPFASFNESIFEETTLDRILSHFDLCILVFKILVVLIVTVIDILLVYVIMKHKRLGTRSNFYILHYSLVNLIYLLFTPVFDIVYGLFLFEDDIIYCLTLTFHNSALFMQIFFSIGLLLDWLLMSFKPHVLAKYHIFQKYFFIFVYVLGLLKSLVCGTSYFHESMIDICEYTEIITKVTYSSSVLLLAIIYILKYRRIQPTKTVYFLTVASWMILSWLPVYFFHFINKYFDVPNVWVRIIFTFFFFSDLLAATAPIWITIHLAKSNKYFKMAFDRILKKKVNNYQSDNLDEASDEEEIVNSNTVQVGDIVVNYHKEISGSGAI